MAQLQLDIPKKEISRQVARDMYELLLRTRLFEDEIYQMYLYWQREIAKMNEDELALAKAFAPENALTGPPRLRRRA